MSTKKMFPSRNKRDTFTLVSGYNMVLHKAVTDKSFNDNDGNVKHT